MIKFDTLDNEGDDYEEFDFDSIDIIWRTKLPKKYVFFPDSNRPSSIVDAVGYEVEVLSREPDAEYGDFFTAKVQSADAQNGKVFHLMRPFLVHAGRMRRGSLN